MLCLLDWNHILVLDFNCDYVANNNVTNDVLGKLPCASIGQRNLNLLAPVYHISRKGDLDCGLPTLHLFQYQPRSKTISTM